MIISKYKENYPYLVSYVTGLKISRHATYEAAQKVYYREAKRLSRLAKQGKAVNHIGIYIDAPSRDFAILALSSSAKPGAFDEVTA